jgi:ligand-binding SRPBCC domain-containing protein
LHFKILTRPPIEMAPRTLIDYKLRLRGIPIRWQSEITEWESPHRFVDEQRRGPYGLWHHEHSFDKLGTGTIVTDDVTYRVKGDAAVNRLFVRPNLERIFDYRARKLDEWVLEQKRLQLPATVGSPTERTQYACPLQ